MSIWWGLRLWCRSFLFPPLKGLISDSHAHCAVIKFSPISTTQHPDTQSMDLQAGSALPHNSGFLWYLGLIAIWLEDYSVSHVNRIWLGTRKPQGRQPTSLSADQVPGPPSFTLPYLIGSGSHPSFTISCHCFPVPVLWWMQSIQEFNSESKQHIYGMLRKQWSENIWVTISMAQKKLCPREHNSSVSFDQS